MTTCCLHGQSEATVSIPAFTDTYSKYVRELESGKIDIDYKDFRESFIESEQFKIASRKSGEFDSLKNWMYAEIAKKNYQEVINLTKKMLSIDYTSMIAHKMLRQTYAIVKDTLRAAKYKAIQFGLLNSIVKNGDGKTCATSWPVIQIEEEYFILQMIGAQLLNQSTDNTGGICDKMDVKTEEGNRTYYFEISKVFEGYKKLGLK